MSKLTAVMDNHRRTVDRLNSISQSITRVTHTAELISSSPAVADMRRTAELISSSPVVADMRRTAELIPSSPIVNVIADSVRKSSLVYRNIIDVLNRFNETDQFNELQWFPHRTFPRHLLDKSGPEAHSDDIVLGYYRQNWPMVCQVIEKELSECHVDEDAKATVRQALIAHEMGLYRLIPSSLFPAIERSVRVSLHEDDVGRIPVRDLSLIHI